MADDIVRTANKVKAVVHKHCPDESGDTKCEHLVYLTVPAAGGDGLLIGVTETELAAETIASALNSMFGFVHTHV